MAGEIAETGNAFLGFEIEDGTVLAGVEVEEVRGALGIIDAAAGAVAAGGIALGGFELEDAGAGVGEEATAVGDGRSRAEFEDGDVREDRGHAFASASRVTQMLHVRDRNRGGPMRLAKAAQQEPVVGPWPYAAASGNISSISNLN